MTTQKLSVKLMESHRSRLTTKRGERAVALTRIQNGEDLVLTAVRVLLGCRNHLM